MGTPLPPFLQVFPKILTLSPPLPRTMRFSLFVPEKLVLLDLPEPPLGRRARIHHPQGLVEGLVEEREALGKRKNLILENRRLYYNASKLGYDGSIGPC
jgi:hypothetical protein